MTHREKSVPRGWQELVDAYVESGLKHWQARGEDERHREYAINEWGKAGRVADLIRNWQTNGGV